MTDRSDILEMAQGHLSRVIAVRLRPGTDVLHGLEEACRRSGINSGVILSAIGSLDGVAYCNPVELPDRKAGYGYGEILHLTGPIELTSGSGIICHDPEGNTNLHVHMGLSDRYGNAHGGHLAEGTKVLLTVDVIIAEIEGLVMGRQFDEELEVPIFNPRQAYNDIKKGQERRENIGYKREVHKRAADGVLPDDGSDPYLRGEGRGVLHKGYARG